MAVKIKGRENKPNAKPGYPKDVLENLSPGASYTVKVPDGEGGETVYTVTADENGKIPLILKDTDGSETDLCGKNVEIMKKGDGTFTTDSEAQSLTIAARPETLSEDQIKA